MDISAESDPDMDAERLRSSHSATPGEMQFSPTAVPACTAAEPLKGAGTTDAAAGSRRYEVLLIDDVELNNVLMAQAISGIAGCATVAFQDPSQALAALEAQPDRFSSVVIDYDMPGMNGIEFVRRARTLEDFRHVPVIMVTSFDQRRIRQEALEAGVTDFMGKPFDAGEVKARLTNLLELNAARRAEHDRSAWLAHEVALATRTIRDREREIVIRLARAAEYRDTDTGNHVTRVSLLARGIAQEIGCDPEWCDSLELASTMHDVGKIAVPDSVLLKPGRLGPEEQTLVRRHTEFGFNILEGSRSPVINLAAEIAISHHERWDGQGYPKGLSGEEIPLSGRIVAVADVFDALVSDRPYKRGWSIQEALGYLHTQTGTQFDPGCVKAFLDGRVWLAAARASQDRPHLAYPPGSSWL